MPPERLLLIAGDPLVQWLGRVDTGLIACCHSPQARPIRCCRRHLFVLVAGVNPALFAVNDPDNRSLSGRPATMPSWPPPIQLLNVTESTR